MKLTDEKILELEELAELQFSLEECAIIMKVELSEKDENVKNAYNRGMLRASAEVRKAILKQAKQGSTPAQKQMMELIKRNSKQKNKKMEYFDI